MFLNFSNVHSFLIFCQKKLIIRAEKTFFRNNTIWYAFQSKFVTFSEIYKNSIFFEKNHLFFRRRPKFERFEKS